MTPEAVLMAVVWLVAIVALGYVALIVVRKFLPEFAEPARWVIGVVVIVAVLLLLLRVARLA
jgi:hypothetical protein